MPIYEIQHVTVYRYRRPVAFGEHRMILLPREGHDQRLLESELSIEPEPRSLRFFDDALGNRVGVATFSGAASSLAFKSRIRVAHSRSHPMGLNLEDRCLSLPVILNENEMSDLRPFLARRYPCSEDALRDWVHGCINGDEPTATIDFITGMIHAIRHGLTYVARHEKGIQTPAETLARGSGTCRDFSELMIAGLRILGLPARFVSGYLYVPWRDSAEIHGGGSTHAWLQVYLPGAGWIDIDPTNAILGNDGLIRTAVVREPSEALPLHGTFNGSAADDLGMKVEVRVMREDAAGAEPEPGPAG